MTRETKPTVTTQIGLRRLKKRAANEVTSFGPYASLMPCQGITGFPRAGRYDIYYVTGDFPIAEKEAFLLRRAAMSDGR
jgi:hypothetical protein